MPDPSFAVADTARECYIPIPAEQSAEYRSRNLALWREAMERLGLVEDDDA